MSKKKKISGAIVFGLMGATFGFSSMEGIEAQSAKVNTTALTVRSGASVNTKAVDYLKKDQYVTILSDHGEFSKVSYANGKQGYVNDKYLTLTKEDTLKKAYVNTGSLNVRNQPNANAKKLTVLKKGQEVTVVKDLGSWSEIRVGNVKGYVNDSYLSTKKVVNATNTNTTNTTATKVYVVKSGDTLYKIATNNKMTVQNLKSLNNLKTDKIKVGQKLKLSGGTVSSSNTAKPNPSQNVSSTTKLKGKVIVLDPGHGGKFSGAQGIVHEEDVNLSIALKLRNELKAEGATVIMTRTADTHLHSVYRNDLIARSNVANRNNAHIFISIHANAGGGTGTEVYFNRTSNGSDRLAREIVTEIAQKTGLKNRGAKKYGYQVLTATKSSVTSVLVETGFTDTKKDAQILGSASGQNKMAEAMAEGILDYYGK